MGRALIIGCGGVAGVVIHKCCQNSDVFEEIVIASRTKSEVRCHQGEAGRERPQTKITHRQGGCGQRRRAVLRSSDEYKPDIVMNMALPYQDLTIMDACLECRRKLY